MNLKPDQQNFWDDYVERCHEQGIEVDENAHIEAIPAGNFEITDGLIDLYLEGKKSAGSGLVEDYETMGDPIPKVGDYWMALGGDGRPRLLLLTERVEFNRFDAMTEEIAIAEGEGDLSVEYWKKAHRELYSPFIKDWGIERIEDAEVVTRFFKIVHRE